MTDDLLELSNSFKKNKIMTILEMKNETKMILKGLSEILQIRFARGDIKGCHFVKIAIDEKRAELARLENK